MAGGGRKGRKMMREGKVYETRGFKRKQQQQQQQQQEEEEEEQTVEELECSIAEVSINGGMQGEEESEQDRDGGRSSEAKEDHGRMRQKQKTRAETQELSPETHHRPESVASSLPDEVLQLVLVKLPLLHLLRVRTVCKSWKDLIYFPLFASLYAHSPPTNYLLVYHDGKLQFYNLDSHKWHILSPPFPLPSSTNILPSPEQLLEISPTNTRILPSAEGLLCFELNFSGTWIIRVWNVLTNAWRDLPPLPDHDVVSVTQTLHVYLSHDRKTFFIWKLVLWTTADPRVLMYDSSKNIWDPVQSAGGFNWSFIYRNVGRSIHLMREKCLAAYSSLQEQPLPDTSPLDRSRLWSEIQMKLLPIFKDGNLVHCGGRVLIPCWLGDDDTRTMEIWEFDRPEMKWRRIDHMPEDGVKAMNTKWVKCLAGNNSLFFIGGVPPVVLIYDMSEKQPRWR